jgi:integrase
VNQRKGRRQGHAPKILEVPVAPVLRALLDKECLDIGPICRSSEGRSSAHRFRLSWRNRAIAGGVHRKVTFNNLRGTAATRVRIGADKKDIGIFTGHKDVEIDGRYDRA